MDLSRTPDVSRVEAPGFSPANDRSRTLRALAPALRRLAQLAAITLVALTFLGAGDGEQARFNKLGHGLMCMCGCNQVLLECNHVGCSYSERMRSELTTAMQRGDSDSLVLQGFVQKYGTTVLAAPTSSGFNRVAWIMPFVAFALSIGAVIVVIRTWKLRVARNAIASQANAPIDIDEFRRRAREETEL